MKVKNEKKITKFFSKIQTIHGLSYIGDHKSSRFSRIFWITALILSFLWCFFFFTQVYRKIFIEPDISITISYKALSEFPFPAVTVCPHNKFPHTTLNYKKNLIKIRDSVPLTDEEKMNMEMAFQTCSISFDDSSDLSLNYTSKEFIKNLSESQFGIHDVIKSICWKNACNINYKIDSEVERVLTLEGFCTTFNLFDYPDLFTDKIHSDFKVYKSYSTKKSNWKLSSGYSQADSDYPRRMGTGDDLEAYLVYDKSKIDRDCFNYQRGYGISWHLPNELPTLWNKGINIHNAHRENSIELKVKSFKMSPELQKYDVKYRECYFDGEKELKFFKAYTENNCKFECMADFIIKQCKCVLYYMPRDNITDICRSKDLECTADADMNFQTDEVQDKCKCYPPCNRIEYELFSREETELPEDVTTMELLGIRDLDDDKENGKNGGNESEQITIFNLETLKSKVEERTSFSAYQMQQFISDFGGLLSLAMGCSILSIVELIYNAFNFKSESEHEDKKDEYEKMQVDEGKENN